MKLKLLALLLLTGTVKAFVGTQCVVTGVGAGVLVVWGGYYPPGHLRPCAYAPATASVPHTSRSRGRDSGRRRFHIITPLLAPLWLGAHKYARQASSCLLKTPSHMAATTSAGHRGRRQSIFFQTRVSASLPYFSRRSESFSRALFFARASDPLNKPIQSSSLMDQ